MFRIIKGKYMESVILSIRIDFISLRVIKNMFMHIKMIRIPLRLRMDYSLILSLYELLFNQHINIEYLGFWG